MAPFVQLQHGGFWKPLTKQRLLSVSYIILELRRIFFIPCLVNPPTSKSGDLEYYSKSQEFYFFIFYLFPTSVLKKLPFS
jgi:hypothetical protein